MKTKIIVLLLLIVAFSCKEKQTETIDYSEENLDITTSVYPENIAKIFEAHGGLDTWDSFETLEFSMVNSEGKETTTTNLKNRKSLIETEKFKIGFDGEDVWLQQDTLAYKGNAKFYYNLMFYFYAMPFILADDGIIYEDVDPLVFEGKTYPGIKISYETGIGESPEDEYILYCNPETHKMEWLAYTVTYFSKEKSKDFHFIKYSNWQEIKGLALPETLSWYKYEDNKPTTKRNDVKFIDVKMSKEKTPDTIFVKPENAEIVE